MHVLDLTREGPGHQLVLFDQSHLGKVRSLHIDLVWDIARLYGIRAAPYNGFFPCMEATYPYAVKNQRKVLWVP